MLPPHFPRHRIKAVYSPRLDAKTQLTYYLIRNLILFKLTSLQTVASTQLLCVIMDKQYSKRQLRPALAPSDRFYCHLISPAISEVK